MVEHHVTLFLRQNVSDPALVADPAKDAQFKEIAVDEMRARKDEVPVTSLQQLNVKYCARTLHEHVQKWCESVHV